MATFKSDIYTTQSAVNSNNRADGRLVAGKVRQATASYTLINTESAADTINLELGVSKKVFKKATGALFKKRKIVFEDGGIRWIG